MKRPIMYLVSMALQVSGILTMPWALWHGIAREDMGSELMLLGLGACVFLLGRRLQAAGEG
ncbi:MAG TPA: hypothetical protein VE404_07945 [Verrucomicrobiae bacterium]|nr:hypothetical protein [Verrucomicrobiae bacterium]